ncbi:MAG: hypothetical protein ABH878_04675, partial [bacterium]
MKAPLKAVRLMLVCFSLSISICGAFAVPQDLYHRQTQIIGKGLPEAYPLADSLLIENTESVVLRDSCLNPEDYTLDYVRGVIQFKSTLALTDTVVVSYQVFPFTLRTSYYHPIRTIHPDRLESGDSTSVPPLVADQPFFDTGSLRKSGTLIRGITIGSNRDLSVESGLNLQVEGRLGRDVDVLALLSDQNTPIQPEGNTATLQEIDKVLIRVQSTHFDATLGDYELQFAGSRFANYYRKLQGARLDGRAVDDRFTLSGAVSKGQYQTNYFLGTEGNQGPYSLWDQEGRTGILVLAGTERVWLDGQLLVRGENNDYTIDYGIGELTFTPRRLISSDSRITVDFQYSSEAFGRDLYAVQGEAKFLSEKVALRTTLISESDARNNPLAFVLTDSSRAVLAGSGDNPAAAQILQVDSVALGQGDYIYQEVSWGGQTYQTYYCVRLDSSIADSGYLNVAFSYVGPEQGDYAREASALGFYYAWVGPNEGDYAPVLRLSLPERRRLADLEVWADPTATTQIKAEAALSEWDRNTFSEQDDGDNVGAAWSVDGNWKSRPVKNPSEFAPLVLNVHAREIENRFAELDRLQEVEYARQWDLDTTLSNGESVREAAFQVQPWQPLVSKASYGFLDKQADGFRSERWLGESRLSGARLPSFYAKADWIRSSSDLIGRQGFWTRGLT